MEHISLHKQVFDLSLPLADGLGLPPTVFLELFRRLHSYREEGVLLQTGVFIFKTEMHLVLFDAVFVAVLRDKVLKFDANQFLKQCAPLTSSSWLMFIQIIPGPEPEFFYGVCRFPGPGEPEALFTNSTIPYCFAEVHTPGTVSVSYKLKDGDKPQIKFLDFFCLFADGHEAKNRESNVQMLLNHIAPVSVREIIRKAIIKARKAHGFLIAVGDQMDTVFHPSEGVFDPRDVVRFIQPVVLEDANADAVVHNIELLANLLSSDGVTILNINGGIAGFRGFVYNRTESGKSELAPEGGARSRAFNSLQAYVANKKLLAAFYQSQDGPSKFCTSVQPQLYVNEGEESAIVTSIFPSRGLSLQYIWVRGTNLNGVCEAMCKFGDESYKVPVVNYGCDEVGVTVPEVSDGIVSISVLKGTKYSNSMNYEVVKNVDKEPIVDNVSVFENNWVYVHGDNFFVPCRVSINGQMQDAVVYSLTQLGFSLPENVGQYRLKVVTKNGESIEKSL